MRHGSYNTTAFKTLYLLQCLVQKPMTVDDIQAAFLAHPDIGKAPSQDSIGIYLNTLREIGCEIRRPTKHTQHCYVLLSHPFQANLSHFSQDTAQDFFSQLRAALDGKLTYWDYFYFHRWLVSVLSHPTQGESTDIQKPEALLGDLAHINWDELEGRLRFLEQAIQAQALLKLTYHRPSIDPEQHHENTPRLRYFLPQRLLARRNTFYVVGYGEDYDVSQMLRLDRIETVQRDVLHPELRDALRQKCQDAHPILVQFLDTTPAQYTAMPISYDSEEHPEIVEADPHNPDACLVLFKTDNHFMVTRHLLSTGRRFRIVFPDTLRQALQDELAELTSLYEEAPSKSYSRQDA